MDSIFIEKINSHTLSELDFWTIFIMRTVVKMAILCVDVFLSVSIMLSQ